MTDSPMGAITEKSNAITKGGDHLQLSWFVSGFKSVSVYLKVMNKIADWGLNLAPLSFEYRMPQQAA